MLTTGITWGSHLWNAWFPYPSETVYLAEGFTHCRWMFG